MAWGFDIKNPIQKAMLQITMIVQNQAKINAPFQTWTLRRSITSDLTRIVNLYSVVGSPVAYARRREYENNLHPDRKFYLKRWYEMNETKIKSIIQTALKSYFW